MHTKTFALVLLPLMLLGCQEGREMAPAEPEPGSFGHDLEFLRKHADVVVLTAPDDPRAQVIVVPAMQGRVMTSTIAGLDGVSLGWINHDLIASGDTLQHINALGGEDRFWMGPEGGQFSIFFKAGDPFDLDHWYTPAGFDSEPFDLVASSPQEATLRKSLELENYSGARFDVEVARTISLIGRNEAANLLGASLDPAVSAVAFASENTIRNTGENEWTADAGLVSIWILGMFTPSPATTVAIPFVTGPEETLGPIVNDAYFGRVPEDRLAVGDEVVFFKGDGEYRSKIGLSPARATPIMGSYDAANNVLTIVQYTKPAGETRYVNSMWELQEAPYAGDVANSYNDGPLAPGEEALGGFYELESSSPAAALSPGEELTHVHRTFHFQGPPAALDAIALETLGVTLKEISRAL